MWYNNVKTVMLADLWLATLQHDKLTGEDDRFSDENMRLRNILAKRMEKALENFTVLKTVSTDANEYTEYYCEKEGLIFSPKFANTAWNYNLGMVTDIARVGEEWILEWVSYCTSEEDDNIAYPKEKLIIVALPDIRPRKF